MTASNLVPLGGGYSNIRWGKEDALSDPSKYQAVDPQIVLPGYFETIHTPLLAGRTFTDADNAPNRNVAIIDQLLAAKAFPNESAIGKRILIRIRTPEPEWVEIIGVVNHQLDHLAYRRRTRTDLLYRRFPAARQRDPLGDPHGGRSRAVCVRSTGGGRETGRSNAIAQMQPMDALVVRAQARHAVFSAADRDFASIAALLARVGLYGVLSTVVRQRTAEIGVRMALGAGPRSVFNLVVGHGLRLERGGSVLGLVAALGLTRAMTSMLVGIKPTDPVTFAVIIVFFFLIAAAACWIPALRAAGLDPTVALRDD